MEKNNTAIGADSEIHRFMDGTAFEKQRVVSARCLNKRVFRILLAALAALAFCTLWIATPWGIGLGPDSLAYIGIARNLLNRAGVSYLNEIGELQPVTHYPPLYPMMISGLGLMGIDVLIAARWLNAFFFAGNLILVSGVVYAATMSYGASLLAPFLFFISLPMAQIHSMAWSEPIFIFFCFGGFFFLARYLRGAKPWVLHLSSLGISLSCLARYAGIGFVMTGALAIFFLSRGNRKKRLFDTIVFLSVSTLPLAAWLARNFWLAGSSANRSLAVHLPGNSELVAAVDSICLWIFPSGVIEVPLWLRLSALGIFIFLICRFVGKEDFSRSRFHHLTALFLLGYIVFLIVARSFADAAINFETRMLAPGYLLAMVLVVSLLTHRLQSNRPEGKFSARLISFIAVVLLAQATAGLSWWRYSYVNGIGYAGDVWRDSELINFANHTAASIFTNVPDTIYMLTGRRTHMIPRKADPKTRLPNSDYVLEIASMKERLRETNGAVVYFYGDERLWFLPSASELQRDSGLRLVAQKKDGCIYQLNTENQ